MRLKLHYQILIAMLLGAGIGLPLNILAGMGRIPEAWPRTFATYGKGVGDIFLKKQARNIGAEYHVQANGFGEQAKCEGHDQHKGKTLTPSERKGGDRRG